MARVPGTTGAVTISYKLFATGAGTLDLFVNTRLATFIEGSRLASDGAPVARVAVARTPKEPLQVVSARFSDAGNTVLFTLSEDSDMLQSYTSTPAAALDSARNVRASAIFKDAATVFGPASYCSFVSPTVLEVTIAGANDQNIAGLAGLLTAVSIASTGAPILNAIGNSAPIPATAPAVVIQGPANPPTPVIQLTGDKSVGKCDPAEYTLKVEGGGCGRPLTLQWTVTLNGAPLGAQLYRISGSTLRILPFISERTETYEVAVTGTNFLNKPSERQTISLLKTNTEVPSVVIAEGARLETSKTADTTLTARATFSACSSSSTVEMEFKWYVGEELQAGATSSSFSIGPGGRVSLAPRSTPYAIRVVGNVKSNPELQNFFTTQLTVKAARLVADAKAFAESGGVRTLTSTAEVDSDVVLDATASFDPDNAAAGFDAKLACKWAVRADSPAHTLSRDASGFIVEGAGASFPSDRNGCVLRIAARTLQPDKTSPQKPFSFEVQVTRNDDLGRAAATASVPVVIVEYAPPAVSIEVEGSRTVNSFRELKLTGSVEAPKDIDADDFKKNGAAKYRVQYLWTVQSVSTLDLQNKEVTESSTGPSLVLKKGVLRPGQTYTFALSVTMEKDKKTRTASAEITLVVNRPPASGSCRLLEPLEDGGLRDVTQGAASKSVTALSKEYRLACGDWITGSPPLQYAFEVEEVGEEKRTSLRGYTPDSTLTKIRAFPVKTTLRFRAYIRDATGAFTVFELDPVAVVSPTAGKSNSDAAKIIKENTDAETDTCIRAKNYGCAFGSITTATSSARRQAKDSLALRRALRTFTSVPTRRRLSAADTALLQIQVDALRNTMRAVEGAGYSRTAVGAAAGQYATVLEGGFVEDYGASFVDEALALAANLTASYVRDCNSYTPETDSVVQNLIAGSLNLFSNEAGVNRTLTSSLALRQLLSQLGRRSLECGTCAATRGNWTSPVAAFALPTASRKDAELLPLQLCASQTVNYPAQTVAFSGFDARIGFSESFALSVLGSINATADRTLSVVALRLPEDLYGGSERFASDVVQLAVYRTGCGARCESLPIADLSEPLSFAGLVPPSAAFDFMSERVSLSRFNLSSSAWTETTPGSIAVRGVDGRYTSNEADVAPARAPAVFHDLAHVVRARPESRNITSRATLGVAFEMYPGARNASAASLFAAGTGADPARLVAALAARIRARAAAVGSAAGQIAAFDQALQLAVEPGAISSSAAGSIDGLQITFSFFGVANPAPGSSRPSSTALRDFVYADALLNGLDLSAADPLLSGGAPRSLNGQRVTSPGVPGLGGFRDNGGSAIPVVLSFPQQAVTLGTLQALFPVSSSPLGNARLVRALFWALRNATNGTSVSADLAKSIEIQVAFVSSSSDAGAILLTLNVFGALRAVPAAGGGFVVAPNATGHEAIARALVHASLNGGLTLALSNGSNLTGGTVRSIGGRFAGVMPYVSAVVAGLRGAAPPVPANASSLNFTVRVENKLGSFAMWFSENYDSLDAASRDDLWALALYNFLRELDPAVNINGVLFAGRSAFADAVSGANGTRRHALQLDITSGPSVDVAGTYRGSSDILGSGSGFSRNSSFCGGSYTIALPTGPAGAKPQCTSNTVKTSIQPTTPVAPGSGSSGSGLSGGQIAGITIGVIAAVAIAGALAAIAFVVKRRMSGRRDSARVAEMPQPAALDAAGSGATSFEQSQATYLALTRDREEPRPAAVSSRGSTSHGVRAQSAQSQQEATRDRPSYSAPARDATGAPTPTYTQLPGVPVRSDVDLPPLQTATEQAQQPDSFALAQRESTSLDAPLESMSYVAQPEFVSVHGPGDDDYTPAAQLI
eukprot:tig00000194_g14804.t1